LYVEIANSFIQQRNSSCYNPLIWQPQLITIKNSINQDITDHIMLHKYTVIIYQNIFNNHIYSNQKQISHCLSTITVNKINNIILRPKY